MVHLSVDKVVEGLPAFEEEECEARGGASLRRLHQRVARDINDVRVDGAFGFEGPRMGHHLVPKAKLIHSLKEFGELKCHNGVYYTIFPRHIQVGAGLGEAFGRGRGSFCRS